MESWNAGQSACLIYIQKALGSITSKKKERERKEERGEEERKRRSSVLPSNKPQPTLNITAMRAMSVGGKMRHKEVLTGGRRGTHPVSGRSVIGELWANSFLRRTSRSP